MVKNILLGLGLIMLPVVNFAVGDCPPLNSKGCPFSTDAQPYTVADATSLACGWRIYNYSPDGTSYYPTLAQTDSLKNPSSSGPVAGVCMYASSITYPSFPWGQSGMLCAPGVPKELCQFPPIGKSTNSK